MVFSNIEFETGILAIKSSINCHTSLNWTCSNKVHNQNEIRFMLSTTTQSLNSATEIINAVREKISTIGRVSKAVNVPTGDGIEIQVIIILTTNEFETMLMKKRIRLMPSTRDYWTPFIFIFIILISFCIYYYKTRNLTVG